MPGQKKKLSKNGGRSVRIPDLVRVKSTFGPGATEVRRLTYFIRQAPNGNGLLPAINAAYMRANCPEWASYAARWTQYRMLQIRLCFTLWQMVAGVTPTFVNDLGVVATDRSGILALPTTIGAVFGMAGAKAFLMLPTSVPCRYVARAIDLEDQNYTPVSVSSTAFQVFVATSTVSPSTVLAIEFMVEFKGSQ